MKNTFLSAVATAAIMAAIAPSGPVFAKAATPIKHLVVIFNENVSFDHYFATYPKAANPPGEIPFTALPGTPHVNNLANTPGLLTNNPNLNKENGAGASNPFRLDRTQAATADQNHGYTAEQQAYDDGKADLFPKYTGSATPGGVGAFGTSGQVMGYYDGNTVTAIWNYAQHFAMSDNAYTDTYGPSTPGALEVISGQTNGVKIVKNNTYTHYFYVNADPNNPSDAADYTLISDVDPAGDTCSNPNTQIQMKGQNIGDLLNVADITWGSFMGGFHLKPTGNDPTGCKRSTYSHTVGAKVKNYIPHHAWFQYYPSTANPHHLRPSSIAAIGHTYDANGKKDPANHNYGLKDFYAALKAGNFPAVSYIKMPAYEDAHAGYSDPLDEQVGVVKLVNFLEQQPDWKSTAVIITYDDSDGWYDHRYATPTRASYDSPADQLNGNGTCGTGTQPNGLDGDPVNGRCGPGTRIPFLVISPYAKKNYVSDTQISLASVVQFVEDNWLRGKRLGHGSFDASTGSIMDMFDFDQSPNTMPLILDPQTGTVDTD